MSSNIIPKEIASRARIWEPPQIDSSVDANSTLVTRLRDHTSGDSQQGLSSIAHADQLRLVRESAAREGFEQGLAEGRAQGARDAAELKMLVASLRDVAQALEQTLAERIVELAVELARCVVRRAIVVRPEFVIDVVREAVASLPELEAQTQIALHPADAVLLREVLRSDPNAALPWHVVEDAQISRGGCKVATRSSSIDASLESRWHRIVAGLGRDDRWLLKSDSTSE